MPHTKACFVGEDPPLLARERPPKWIGCRTLCDEHKPFAILPNGENLTAFLERRVDKQFPLEGSGLNYLINPVKINSLRAWCDFHFEAPVIYEEVFPSETYFDFFVQHAEEIQPFFYVFYQTYQKLQGSGNFFLTVLALRKESHTTEKHLNDLINMWTLQEALQQELKLNGLAWVKSPDNARDLFFTVYERLNEETILANVVNDMLKRMVDLGQTRFAHL